MVQHTFRRVNTRSKHLDSNAHRVRTESRSSSSETPAWTQQLLKNARACGDIRIYMHRLDSEHSNTVQTYLFNQSQNLTNSISCRPLNVLGLGIGIRCIITITESGQKPPNLVFVELPIAKGLIQEGPNLLLQRLLRRRDHRLHKVVRRNVDSMLNAPKI